MMSVIMIPETYDSIDKHSLTPVSTREWYIPQDFSVAETNTFDRSLFPEMEFVIVTGVISSVPTACKNASEVPAKKVIYKSNQEWRSSIL